jgi:hypothetical protein
VIFCALAQRPLGHHVARHPSGAAVIVPGRRFPDYLAVMCGLIRRYGAREPTVADALLRLLGACADVAGNDPELCTAIEDQARIIIADAEREIPAARRPHLGTRRSGNLAPRGAETPARGTVTNMPASPSRPPVCPLHLDQVDIHTPRLRRGEHCPVSVRTSGKLMLKKRGARSGTRTLQVESRLLWLVGAGGKHREEKRADLMPIDLAAGVVGWLVQISVTLGSSWCAPHGASMS